MAYIERNALQSILKRLKIKPPYTKQQLGDLVRTAEEYLTQREFDILIKRNSGMKLKTISKEYDISYERIQKPKVLHIKSCMNA